MVEFITDNQRSLAHQGGDVASVCGESHSKHHSSRFPDKPRDQGFEFLVDRKSACCKRMLKEIVSKEDSTKHVHVLRLTRDRGSFLFNENTRIKVNSLRTRLGHQHGRRHVT